MRGFDDRGRARYGRPGWEHVLPGKGCSPASTLAAAAAGLCGVLAVNFAATAIIWRVADLIGYPPATAGPQLWKYGAGAAAVLMTGLLIPVAEEIFFRGILFGSLRTRCGFAESAILPSLAFGLIHGWPTCCPTFLSAMLLCWLYERTRRLGAPILVHVINNLLVLAVPVSEEMLTGNQSIPAAGLALVAAILAVHALNRMTEGFYCQND